MLLTELFGNGINLLSEQMPDHMGLDLVTDVSQNTTEIVAQYNSTGGDIDLTLSKLQQSNPSWRMILKKHGRGYAKKLILKHVKS